MISPERILADAKQEAEALRRNGHAAQAGSIERLCEAFRAAPVIADALAWISENEAVLRSGRSPDYLRDRRRQWEEDGYAEKRGRFWYYRRCIVPRRKLSSIQRQQAKSA